jgi:hypothetical protein
MYITINRFAIALINHTLLTLLADMKPSVSISIVVVACIFLYGTYLDSAAQFVAASEPSALLRLEAKALLESGWWGSANTSNTSIPPCKR